MLCAVCGCGTGTDNQDTPSCTMVKNDGRGTRPTHPEFNGRPSNWRNVERYLFHTRQGSQTDHPTISQSRKHPGGIEHSTPVGDAHIFGTIGRSKFVVIGTLHVLKDQRTLLRSDIPHRRKPTRPRQDVDQRDFFHLSPPPAPPASRSVGRVPHLMRVKNAAEKTSLCGPVSLPRYPHHAFRGRI